ncbi:MAG: hypothetical protein O7F71_17115 [Gammaproteobacteria bacterium]|nr:hypothetical protein [Gammaproteobacteria bacterium]
MKKSISPCPILAAVVTVTGCVPMEPVAQVPDDDICRMESPIGSHVKEEDCKRDSDGQRGSNARSDRDINGVFGDIVLERGIESPDAAEGSCGGLISD